MNLFYFWLLYMRVFKIYFLSWVSNFFFVGIGLMWKLFVRKMGILEWIVEIEFEVG